MSRDTCVQTSYDEATPGPGISETPEWQDLVSHVTDIKKAHLKDLLFDESRIDALCMESDGVYADFSRQRVSVETKEVRTPTVSASGQHHSARCRSTTPPHLPCRSS